jgi:hypothetical protein
MRISKRSNPTTVDPQPDNQNKAKILEDFAVLISESLHMDKTEDKESFEMYATHIIARLQGNRAEFCSKFAKGYLTILAELQKK